MHLSRHSFAVFFSRYTYVPLFCQDRPLLGSILYTCFDTTYIHLYCGKLRLVPLLGSILEFNSSHVYPIHNIYYHVQ